jgi:hypothetical protein
MRHCGPVTLEVLSELARAQAKFPTWPIDPVHAAAIVAEESGELQRAALRYTYESATLEEMVAEARQVGAMAIRFIMNADTLRKRSSPMRYDIKAPEQSPS